MERNTRELLTKVSSVTGKPATLLRVFTDGEIYRDLYLDSLGVHPYPSSQVDLGTSTYRWKDIYSVNSPIVGSDKRIKKDISPLEVSLITKLLMSIPAVQYRLIDGDSGRIHYGFIAQDVENALNRDRNNHYGFCRICQVPYFGRGWKRNWRLYLCSASWRIPSDSVGSSTGRWAPVTGSRTVIHFLFLLHHNARNP